MRGISRLVRKLSLGCQLTVQLWSKSRLIKAVGTQAFLGLAICVFAWGLQYKLSLYNPPQAASHQIPTAKLLSRDEQSSTAKLPLVIRTKTSTSVIYTAPTANFLILLLAISLLNPPESTRVEKRANRLLHLHRAILNTLFRSSPSRSRLDIPSSPILKHSIKFMQSNAIGHILHWRTCPVVVNQAIPTSYRGAFELCESEPP